MYAFIYDQRVFRGNGAYEQAAIEEMERRALAVQAMHPIKDKRARLRAAARYIKDPLASSLELGKPIFWR
jgi:hypothetical protein